MKKNKLLIIGGGFGGCTSARLFGQKDDWDITMIESTNELGGGVRTRFKSGHPYTFGPRHFLTHNEKVYNYLNEIVPMRRCAEHEFLSYIENDKNFYSYPIHEDDIPRMPDSKAIKDELNKLDEYFKDKSFALTHGNKILEEKASDYEDFWIRSVGPTLYKKFIKDYTKKMWQIDDNSVISDFSWSPKGVAIKKGPRAGWDTAISAYPIANDGYNKYFDETTQFVDKMLFNHRVEKLFPNKNKVLIDGIEYEFDLIINTVPVDDLIKESGLPKLDYIGRRIEYVILPVEFALPNNVYFTYYCGKEDYTRVCEYKKFSNYKSPNTLISLEYPVLKGGKYYPLPTAEMKLNYKTYCNLMNDKFICIGRIGKYNYRYDIDDVIEQALEVYENFK